MWFGECNDCQKNRDEKELERAAAKENGQAKGLVVMPNLEKWKD